MPFVFLPFFIFFALTASHISVFPASGGGGRNGESYERFP